MLLNRLSVFVLKEKKYKCPIHKILVFLTLAHNAHMYMCVTCLTPLLPLLPAQHLYSLCSCFLFFFFNHPLWYIWLCFLPPVVHPVCALKSVWVSVCAYYFIYFIHSVSQPCIHPITKCNCCAV